MIICEPALFCLPHSYFSRQCICRKSGSTSLGYTQKQKNVLTWKTNTFIIRLQWTATKNILIRLEKGKQSSPQAKLRVPETKRKEAKLMIKNRVFFGNFNMHFGKTNSVDLGLAFASDQCR